MKSCLSLLGLVFCLSACSSTDTSTGEEFEINVPKSQEEVANRMFFSHMSDKQGDKASQSMFEGKKFDSKTSSGWNKKFEKKEYYTNSYQDIRKEGVFSGKKFDGKTANETRKSSDWQGQKSGSFDSKFKRTPATEGEGKGVERKVFAAPQTRIDPKQRSEIESKASRKPKIVRDVNKDAPMSLEEVSRLLKGR